jgi:hypothetical protein
VQRFLLVLLLLPLLPPLLAAGLRTTAAEHKVCFLLSAAAVRAESVADHTYGTVPSLLASTPLHCCCTAALLLLLLEPLLLLLLLLLPRDWEECRHHCCCCRWLQIPHQETALLQEHLKGLR